VYVSVLPLDKSAPESALRFVGTSKMQRFVLITISEDAAADRRVELLGHELQHAASERLRALGLREGAPTCRRLGLLVWTSVIGA
jgi:hypothetical protein